MGTGVNLPVKKWRIWSNSGSGLDPFLIADCPRTWADVMTHDGLGRMTVPVVLVDLRFLSLFYSLFFIFSFLSWRASHEGELGRVPSG